MNTYLIRSNSIGLEYLYKKKIVNVLKNDLIKIYYLAFGTGLNTPTTTA